MEHLARELARLAWQLEQDVEQLRDWANGANQSEGSDESVEESLGRIEGKLGIVHDHTAELIERVPSDLGQILSDLKGVLLARLDEVTANWSIESASACRSGVGNQENHSFQSPASAPRLLTPQERRVFQLCFQTGFLSYRDIASHLEITPTAAKNLVNRIFLSDRKRPLFTKQYQHGAVRVGIQPDIKGRLLGGRNEQSEPEKRTFVRPLASSGGENHSTALAATLTRHRQKTSH